MTKEKLLTEKDLANRWGLTIVTIQRNRRSKNNLPYIRISGRIRYRLSDVEDYERVNTYKNRSNSKTGEV